VLVGAGDRREIIVMIEKAVQDLGRFGAKPFKMHRR
jgi:hypothetical protein